MRNTTKDSKVNVVIDGKAKKGTIVEVISQGAARIELGDGSTIQASHSLLGEEGTFHYPDKAEAAAMEEAQAAAKEAPKPAEPEAKPAKK